METIKLINNAILIDVHDKYITPIIYSLLFSDTIIELQGARRY